MQEKFAASYLTNAVAIIENYKGEMPFHIFLKKYFSQYKKFGSKDRKHISQFCYSYFRIGHAGDNISIEERIKLSFFLCNENISIFAALYNDEWINNWYNDLEKRIAFVKTTYSSFNEKNIFPWRDELSETIDSTAFALSHMRQPDLFIRIRPGKKETVIQKLNANNISYKIMNDDCLALDNATKIDTILAINKEAVIQDYSSQRIKEFLQSANEKPETRNEKRVSVWDCCAASGGKSILAFDTLQNISLTVSDIRLSIIHNLTKRFEEAGIKNYTSFVADLTSIVNRKSSKFNIQHSTFKIIICDTPCTGSGTWGRTPEQLYYFNQNKIEIFNTLQKKIVSITIPHLDIGGYFLYITCSVFKKENEKVVAYIKENFHLTLIKMEVLNGYSVKADTMFAALFVKQ